MKTLNNNVLIASLLTFLAQYPLVSFTALNAVNAVELGTCNYKFQVKISGQIITIECDYHAKINEITHSSDIITPAMIMFLNRLTSDFNYHL